jgi:hypothetical protein
MEQPGFVDAAIEAFLEDAGAAIDLGLSRIKAQAAETGMLPLFRQRRLFMNDDAKSSWKTFTEEVEVAGQHLVDEVNRLLAEGNLRKLEIRSEHGDVYLSVPLTAGAVAGGVVALAAPWVAVIAAIAGLLGKVKLQIVRTEPPATPPPTEPDNTPPADG